MASVTECVDQWLRLVNLWCCNQDCCHCSAPLMPT
jgi:hypothetical protein